MNDRKSFYGSNIHLSTNYFQTSQLMNCNQSPLNQQYLYSVNINSHHHSPIPPSRNYACDATPSHLNVLLMMSEVLPSATQPHESSFPRSYIHPDYFNQIFSRKRGRPSLTKKEHTEDSALSKDLSPLESAHQNFHDLRETSGSMSEQMRRKTKKSITSKIARERRKIWEKSLLDLYTSLYLKIEEKEARLRTLGNQVEMLKNLLHISRLKAK